MFPKVHQKGLQKCAKMFAKVRKKLFGKSVPKMFEKVRRKTAWQKCAKKDYKSAPKMFEKVRQNV